jgi:hypothetical protein
MISVLESKIDLSARKMDKRHTEKIFADTNYKHSTAKRRRLDKGEQEAFKRC